MLNISLITAVLAWTATVKALNNRAECQRTTPNPTTGCPKNTLLVGPTQNFTSVQQAVLSIPNNTVPYTILILAGNYTEQVNVTRQAPLTLLGETNEPNDATKNLVNIIWSDATGNANHTYDNAFTSTLTVAPTLNASETGSGTTGNPVTPGTPFGNSDFRTYNLNFVNDYQPYSAGPSLAVGVSYANASFYYTQFLSAQDTVYIGKIGNAYMYDSVIAGQTDFLYGFGTLWVEKSVLSLRGCGGGITAWKGTNTTWENKYGVYVHRSHVLKANDTLNITGECPLGRPWNAAMRSIFSYSYLDDSIKPSGFIQWSSTDPRISISKDYPSDKPVVVLLTRYVPDTTMAEFENYGPGYNETTLKAASNITQLLTSEQFAPYKEPSKVFQYPNCAIEGNVAWIDINPAA